VVSGSGTESDPYIIELWSIDASSCDTSVWPYIKVGIAVYSTEKYFVIRDCQVENADEYGSGISLSFLSNGTIQNCTLGNSGSGISLSGCDNVVISGNTLENCENGITNGSYSSDGITISDNSIAGCTDTGIEFHYLTNSSCTGNNVSDNNQGIYVSALWFGSCTISDNIVQGNTLEGIDVTGDSEENSGSGIKLDYTGLTDITADNNTVSNNTASSNGMDGIYVGSNCVNNTISDNTCLSNNALEWYYDDETPWYYDISINAAPNSLTGNTYGTIYIY
jgi:parallel beta-helix repeat protein